MAIKPVCTKCGSDDVGTDAAARWSVEHQRWELSDAYECNAFCSACDGETSLRWTNQQCQHRDDGRGRCIDCKQFI